MCTVSVSRFVENRNLIDVSVLLSMQRQSVEVRNSLDLMPVPVASRVLAMGPVGACCCGCMVANRLISLLRLEPLTSLTGGMNS
jgi:hypothetical protein